MFTKASIFVLLGTSLVLANSLNEEVAEQPIDQIWKHEVEEYRPLFDDALVRFHDKGERHLHKSLNILKKESEDIAQSLEEKWVILKKEYHVIKKNLSNVIKESEPIFQKDIQKLELNGVVAAKKNIKYAKQARKVLEKQYDKFKGSLEAWFRNVEVIVDEAKNSLSEQWFEAILSDIYKKFGDLNKSDKENLKNLEREYYKLKNKEKNVTESFEQEQKKDDTKVSNPLDYNEEKTSRKLHVAEKADLEYKLENVKNQILETITQILKHSSHKGNQYKQ